jgi:hypothetical protein
MEINELLEAFFFFMCCFFHFSILDLNFVFFLLTNNIMCIWNIISSLSLSYLAVEVTSISSLFLSSSSFWRARS